MTQHLIDLAPAAAEADRTVNALQALSPEVAVEAPDPAGLPNLGTAPLPKTLDGGGSAAPASIPTATPSAASAGAGLPPLVKGSSNPGTPAGAPPGMPGMITAERSVKEPLTEEQFRVEDANLKGAQDKEKRAAAAGTTAAAVGAGIEYWNERAATMIAAQRVQAQQKFLQGVEQRYNEMYEKTSEGELDPGRIFSSDKGTWPLATSFLGAAIGFALGGPIGGLALLLKGTQKAMRDDIEAQKFDQNSRLRMYERELGSLELAQQRLYEQQMGLLAQQARQAAAEAKARGSNSAVVAFADLLEAQHQRERANFLQSARSAATTQYVDRELATLQATRGRGLPGEEGMTSSGDEDQDLINGQLPLIYPGMKPNQAYDAWTKYNDQAAGYETGRYHAEEAMKIISKYKDGDVAGLGPLAKYIPTSVASKGAVAVRQYLGFAVAQYLKEVSGAAVTEQEFERTLKNIEGSGTTDEVQRGLNQIIGLSQAKGRSLDQTNPAAAKLRRELGTRRGQRETASNDVARASAETASTARRADATANRRPHAPARPAPAEALGETNPDDVDEFLSQ